MIAKMLELAPTVMPIPIAQEHENRVERVFDRGAEPDDRQRADHAKGQHDVRGNGHDDHRRNERGHRNRHRERLVIHRRLIAFLVDEQCPNADQQRNQQIENNFDWRQRQRFKLFEKFG
ncbi:MAG: hypothetical protein MZU79_02715 [Anaerotruncus sp.]|nr:hypothetical protein [Anaerotruncus sp.]